MNDNEFTEEEDESEDYALGDGDEVIEGEIGEESETDEDGFPVYILEENERVEEKNAPVKPIRAQDRKGRFVSKTVVVGAIERSDAEEGESESEGAEDLSPAVQGSGELVPLDASERVLSFKKMFDSAIGLFKDQAMLNDEDKEVPLSDLIVRSAKTHSFLDAISGATTADHELEILAGSKDKFKREDELELLNDLMKQCKSQIKTNEKIMELMEAKLDEMHSCPGDFSPEEIASFIDVVDKHRGSIAEMIVNMRNLIQLERSSGGRPLGARAVSNHPIGYLAGVEAMSRGESLAGLGGKSSGGGLKPGTGKPRKISAEELKGMG